MDEATGAAIKEDGAENDPFNGDRAAENDPFNGERSAENSNNSLAEDTADRVGVFCCRDCGEAFGEEAAYLEHRQQHPQENCVMYLDDQLGGLHDSEKDSDVANFCTICSMSFVELSEFHSHMESNHGQTSHKESGIQIVSGTTKQHTYECTDCGKSYGVIGHFLNHQRSHRQASKSVFHDLEHLKKKSFQCESCGRNYSRASALDAHRRCHEGKLVKSRNRSSGDSFHIEETMAETKPSENQTDDTEKLFKCSCGKAFTALLRLKTHQRFSRNSQCTPEEMKEKEKPKKSCSEFYCSECKKGFNGHIALFNHQRWHANHSDESAKRFPCEECGKVFMTLTFYYRHQRMAHSDETPSKSFHHQVCQLQKKAFECKDCGLKFSRASALHSHQLHHTDVFRETEGAAQTCLSLLPPQKVLEGEMTQQVESENVPLTNVAEEDSQVNETDEDMESYEPGDFNVQVISASESEDEPVQDLNPDLELLCESDQEGRDDSEIEISPINFVSKPEMDLKIVQIDFEPAEEPCTLVTREAEDKPTVERFDCPDCYRWFTSASSLRVHRMWHGIHKRRQQTQVQQRKIVCQDCGMKFTSSELFKAHLHQHALKEEEEEEEEEEEAAQTGDNRSPTGRVLDQGEDADWCDMSSSSQTKLSGFTQGDAIAKTSMKNELQKGYTCLVCGKVYTYMVSFRKHQQLHENPTPEPKMVSSLHKYECSECGMTFIRQARLIGHMRIHNPEEPLEPNTPRCDQCNRHFRSIEAWMAHMDNHKQKPFWCLSCAKGFRDEESLDRHLQNHNLKKFECNICNKSFRMSSQLRNHYSIHGGSKPFQCAFCGMSFSNPKSLVSHRKRHLRVYGMSSSFKSSANRMKQMIKRRRFFLTSVKEEPEMEKCAEMPPEVEDNVTTSETPCEDAEFEDQANSDESDCGEPVHHYKLSKLTVFPGLDDPDEVNTETVRLETGAELDGSETQETKMHREHKYWEWECMDCDMGFDDVEKLHLHYIKHATGELPIPQGYIEG